VVATGNASVILQSANFLCSAGDGILAAVDASGAPTLTIVDGQIAHSAAAGIHLQGGDLTLVNSDLIDNSVGVWVDATTPASSAILLGNDLLCSKIQFGVPSGWTTAVDVWNASSSAAVTVAGSSWNDAVASAWSCPSASAPSATNCACASDGGCNPDAGAFDIAVVNGGTVSATNDQATNATWGACVP